VDDESRRAIYLNRLLTLSMDFMAPRIFLTAAELDIFGLLGTDKLTSSEVAARLEADARAVEILLNALVGMGLLKKDGGEFSNTAGLAKLILADGTGFLRGFGYAARLWEAWSQLTDIVKSGRPADFPRTKKLKRDTVLSMMNYAGLEADALVKIVDCSDTKRLLDLGGGAGLYAIAFTRKFPRLKAVLFERDEEALKLARKKIAEANLEDRITLESGDFMVDNFGKNYDVILLSSILCLFSREQNLSLLRKAGDALAAGGRIVIWDVMVDDSGVRPASAAVFSVKMLVTTREGRSHSRNQVEAWLRSTGFGDLRRVPVSGFQVITARKMK